MNTPPSPDLPTRFLLGLLFDEHQRQAFAEDRHQAMQRFGLDSDQAKAFADVDLAGLAADAEGRQRYLMSAVCRAYPLSAGALGSTLDGPRVLRAFMASPAMQRGAAARNLAFGAHLERLLQLDSVGLGDQTTGFLGAFLALERGLVDNAARVRQAVAEDAAPPAPRRPGKRDLATKALVLPQALVAVRLPTSPEVLRAALHGIRPEDAWQRIRGLDLSAARVQAVARARHQPVTLLARAVVSGLSVTRGGAGGVAPLVEIHHRTVELTGSAEVLLKMCDGSMRVGELTPRHQSLAKALLDAGLLELA